MLTSSKSLKGPEEQFSSHSVPPPAPAPPPAPGPAPSLARGGEGVTSAPQAGTRLHNADEDETPRSKVHCLQGGRRDRVKKAKRKGGREEAECLRMFVCVCVCVSKPEPRAETTTTADLRTQLRSVLNQFSEVFLLLLS